MSVSINSAAASSVPSSPGAPFAGDLGTFPPVQAAAAVATPTVSMSTSQPGATPTQVVAGASNVALASRYTFSGAGLYEVPSQTFPHYNRARAYPIPNNPLGFGAAVVDFLSDAPTISFNHNRAAGGASRILVDGVEVVRVVPGTRAGTAQAGAASTITLDAAASATNGQYVGNWLHITGGTGAGQYAQVSAYVGSTKVATVQPAWSTAPDNTSTFEITDTKAAYSNLTNTGAGSYWLAFAWGERRLRHYRVEHSGQAFDGAYVTGASDTVAPAPKLTGSRCIWVGDSFSAGSGGDEGTWGSLALVACDQLG